MVQRDHHMPLQAQSSLTLKLTEPKVDKDNPWADDLLRREEIATRLTNLVATQEPPLSISLHGQWGTGKTFMLTRWQKALEKENYRAIYFNAWEDDFCDQPLLAIVGQLSEHFKDTRWKTIVQRLAGIAVSLTQQAAVSTVKSYTGITIPTNLLAHDERSLLEAYHQQRADKDTLRKQLGALSRQVATNTGHPLIFIIDELDRCRPTFAIELLERIKHMFDVPHLVFVFGLNRDELCKSLSCVYGDIKSDVYLRRFFDFEFQLSEVDSSGFATHLMDKFQIGQVFEGLSARSGNPTHMRDYDNCRTVVPLLWSTLRLSLRDIDYGVRLLALLARNLPLGVDAHPYLLAFLVAMKFKNADLYSSLISGNFRTNEIMGEIEKESRPELAGGNYAFCLDRLEGFLYCADNANNRSQERGEAALTEFQTPPQGSRGPVYEVLSRRAQSVDRNHTDQIIQAIHDGRDLRINGAVFASLANLIDTSQDQLRS